VADACGVGVPVAAVWVGFGVEAAACDVPESRGEAAADALPLCVGVVPRDADAPPDDLEV